MKPRTMNDSGAAARRSQIYFSMHHKDHLLVEQPLPQKILVEPKPAAPVKEPNKV